MKPATGSDQKTKKVDMSRYSREQKERASNNAYRVAISTHYRRCWQSDCEMIRFDKGPIDDLPVDFRVLRFLPSDKRKMWTYATQCMSQPADSERLELHMFSSTANDGLAELLVATAHYHRTEMRLRLHDTINFGRPWIDESVCTHGLLSLPFIDGSNLEWLETDAGIVRVLWLVPLSRSEVVYAREKGAEALEERLEQAGFNYLDPLRLPVA